MFSFEHSIRIAAPPERVWGVTTDVERWPEFVPHFASVKRVDEGPLGLGKRARIKPKGFAGAAWTVREYEDGRSFLWEASMLPGLRVTGGHAVAPDDGGTLLTLTLRAGGPTWVVLGPLLAGTFRQNVQREAEGFKAYCERSAP